MTLSSMLLSDNELRRLLAEHPELRADPDQYCPTCAKVGTYRWQGQDYQCDCATQLRLYKRYLASGIGVPYQRLSWMDIDAEVLSRLKPIMEFLEDPEPYISRGIGVWLWGPPGTGKTMVATLILKDLIGKGHAGFSASQASTVEAFTAGWGGNTDEKLWFQEKFLRSRVLLLDELRPGTTRLDESTFDHILRTRVHNGRPTIITTNMTPGGLESGYGSSILSLLVEQSVTVNLTGCNFRGQAHDRVMAEIRAGEKRPIL